MSQVRGVRLVLTALYCYPGADGFRVLKGLCCGCCSGLVSSVCAVHTRAVDGGDGRIGRRVAHARLSGRKP